MNCNRWVITSTCLQGIGHLRACPSLAQVLAMYLDYFVSDLPGRSIIRLSLHYNGPNGFELGL
jgi:hypothetical protein